MKFFKRRGQVGSGSWAVVDTTGVPAHLVLQRTTEDVSADHLEKIRRMASEWPGAEVMPWDELPPKAEEVIRAFLSADHYAEFDVARGVCALVERFPGAQIGVTWNSGVAITTNDFDHSRKTFAAWSHDPDAYEANRMTVDPRADPVRPEWHFVPLLGQDFRYTDG